MKAPCESAVFCDSDEHTRLHGGEVDKVGFRQFAMEGGGHRRGLAAAAPMLKDEVALSVPLDVCMRCSLSLASGCACGAVFAMTACTMPNILHAHMRNIRAR